MQVKPGDHLKVSGHRVGEPSKHAEILEVRGDHGQPPYYVRWSDGHESLVSRTGHCGRAQAPQGFDWWSVTPPVS